MIVVSGATGNIGREVMRLLKEAGVPATGLSRRGLSRQGLSRHELSRRADPAGAATSRPVEDGSAGRSAEGLSVGDLVRPEDAPAAEAVLYLARAARPELISRAAERVVVVSAATVEFPAGEPRFREDFLAAERAAVDSGLQWTMLRSVDYASNALAWAPQIKTAGIVRGAYPAAVTSTVDERDVAAVAVRALVDDAHAGRAYVLTGPQPLTQPDKVAAIGRALGRDLRFAELTPEQVRAGMLAAGLPEEIPARLLGSLADYARVPGPASTTVEEILGRPARTFGQWAADHADAFR